MRDIDDKYWFLFLMWKLVALIVFFATSNFWILALSFLTSVPFYLYLFKFIGPKEWKDNHDEQST